MKNEKYYFVACKAEEGGAKKFDYTDEGLYSAIDYAEKNDSLWVSLFVAGGSPITPANPNGNKVRCIYETRRLRKALRTGARHIERMRNTNQGKRHIERGLSRLSKLSS